MKIIPVHPKFVPGMILLAISASALFIHSTAKADPNLNCAAYATAAVEQYNHLKSLGCNYKGGRWSANYQGHLNWCRQEGVTINHVSIEDQMRKDGLQKCKQKVSACDSYAADAVKAQEANLKQKCKFKGGRWSSNYSGHKKWCMAASEANIQKEITIRAKGLSECLLCDNFPNC